MNDALPFFGIAAAISSLALLVWTGGRVWLRAKELETQSVASLDPASAAALSNMMANVDARLERLEQIVDTTAVEVERIAEAQRFAAHRLAGGETGGGFPAKPTTAK